MHDPDVVAFEIPRPWPQRAAFGRSDSDARWQIRYRHRCDDPSTCNGCRGRSNSQMFPWWKQRSYSRFWTLAGVRLYWPALITVWHHDPSDYDHGVTCKRGSRWRLHVHHWRIQVHPAQAFRRWLLTRCEWCGGRSRKGDYVNVSKQWDRTPGRWWRGERGLFHSDCSAVENAHRTCLCADPLTQHDGWGTCAMCGKFRVYGQTAERAAPSALIVARVPLGQRLDPDTKSEVSAMWKRLREETP
jgi:hypothetical protein